MSTRVMVETKDKTSRIKSLQKEIEQLKKLLLKKDLDQMVDESYLKVAASKLGYKNVLDLKKTKYLALEKAVGKNKGFASISNICECFNLKRDAYYKYKNRADIRIYIEQKIYL